MVPNCFRSPAPGWRGFGIGVVGFGFRFSVFFLGFGFFWFGVSLFGFRFSVLGLRVRTSRHKGGLLGGVGAVCRVLQILHLLVRGSGSGFSVEGDLIF